VVEAKAKVKIKKKVKMDASLCSRCNLCLLACSLVKFDVFEPEKSFVRLIGEGDEVLKIKLSRGCDMCGDCFDACHYGAMTMTRVEVVKK